MSSLCSAVGVCRIFASWLLLLELVNARPADSLVFMTWAAATAGCRRLRHEDQRVRRMRGAGAARAAPAPRICALTLHELAETGGTRSSVTQNDLRTYWQAIRVNLGDIDVYSIHLYLRIGRTHTAGLFIQDCIAKAWDGEVRIGCWRPG